jgi:hypothetical protein
MREPFIYNGRNFSQIENYDLECEDNKSMQFNDKEFKGIVISNKYWFRWKKFNIHRYSWFQK